MNLLRDWLRDLSRLGELWDSPDTLTRYRGFIVWLSLGLAAFIAARLWLLSR